MAEQDAQILLTPELDWQEPGVDSDVPNLDLTFFNFETPPFSPLPASPTMQTNGGSRDAKQFLNGPSQSAEEKKQDAGKKKKKKKIKKAKKSNDTVIPVIPVEPMKAQSAAQAIPQLLVASSEKPQEQAEDLAKVLPAVQSAPSPVAKVHQPKKTKVIPLPNKVLSVKAVKPLKAKEKRSLEALYLSHDARKKDFENPLYIKIASFLKKPYKTASGEDDTYFSHPDNTATIEEAINVILQKKAIASDETLLIISANVAKVLQNFYRGGNEQPSPDKFYFIVNTAIEHIQHFELIGQLCDEEQIDTQVTLLLEKQREFSQSRAFLSRSSLDNKRSGSSAVAAKPVFAEQVASPVQSRLSSTAEISVPQLASDGKRNQLRLNEISMHFPELGGGVPQPKPKPKFTRVQTRERLSLVLPPEEPESVWRNNSVVTRLSLGSLEKVLTHFPRIDEQPQPQALLPDPRSTGVPDSSQRKSKTKFSKLKPKKLLSSALPIAVPKVAWGNIGSAVAQRPLGNSEEVGGHFPKLGEQPQTELEPQALVSDCRPTEVPKSPVGLLYSTSQDEEIAMMWRGMSSVREKMPKPQLDEKSTPSSVNVSKNLGRYGLWQTQNRPQVPEAVSEIDLSSKAAANNIKTAPRPSGVTED